MDSKRTGLFIAYCRKQKQMTQQQLADTLGVTNKAVSKWETGQGMPDISILESLSQILGVSIDEIIRGEKQKNTTNHPEEQKEDMPEENTVEITTKMDETILLDYYKNMFPIKTRKRRYLIYFLLTILGISIGMVVWDTNWIVTILVGCLYIAVVTITICFVQQQYKLAAKRKLKKNHQLYGSIPILKVLLQQEKIHCMDSFLDIQLPYHKIKTIIETECLILLTYETNTVLLDKRGIKDHTVMEVLELFHQKAPQAFCKKYIPSNQSKIKNIVGVSCIIIGALLQLLQIVYYGLHYSQGVEYLWDGMLYWINGILIALVGIGIISLVWPKRKWILTSSILAMLLLVLNLFGSFISQNKNETIWSISPDGSNSMVMKRNPDTGRTYDYHHHKLFFISSGSQLPYTVSKNKKIQWLTNDICAFTYMSPDDSQIHQYIATYGDRTLGSYYYVTNVIGGDWTTYDTNNTVGWHILVDDGIMLKYGETKEYYSLDDCVQFGTTAIALCKNGIPQWTIVLNEDCEVTSGSDLTGTITLCKVSMDQTAPTIFHRSSSEANLDELEELKLG